MVIETSDEEVIIHRIGKNNIIVQMSKMIWEAFRIIFMGDDCHIMTTKEKAKFFLKS